MLIKDRYDELSNEYKITAKEYFKVLQLARYVVDGGKYLETSTAVVREGLSQEAWLKACDILETLHNDERR